jgi:hypothetical protein
VAKASDLPTRQRLCRNERVRCNAARGILTGELGSTLSSYRPGAALPDSTGLLWDVQPPRSPVQAGRS